MLKKMKIRLILLLMEAPGELAVFVKAKRKMLLTLKFLLRLNSLSKKIKRRNQS
jgi:hypothetical protein